MQRISLSAIVISLVSITLVFELVLLASIATCHQQIEEEGRILAQAKRVSLAISNLRKNMLEIDVALTKDAFTPIFIRNMDVQMIAKTWGEYYAELEEAFKDDPKTMAIVKQSHEGALDGLRIFEDLHTHPEKLTTKDDRARWLLALNSSASAIMSEEFSAIGSDQKILTTKNATQKIDELRSSERIILIVGVLLNVIVSILVANFLIKWIVQRINIVSKNAQRLASGQPLNPLIAGSDEIRELDEVFHSMASALEESAKKERAIIENARDMICSIDAEGKFTAVNPAAMDILMCEPSDLLGRRIASVVANDDIDHALSEIDNAMDSTGQANFECRLKRKDGAIVDTLWSVRWSELERSLFCVVHNDTERKQTERLKQEVVAMVTHDLRSPLTTIRHFIEMLEANMLGELNTQGEELLKIADRSSSRMLSLTNDLLDIEKIKSGMLELDLKGTNLSSILESTAQVLEPIAAKTGLKIEIETVKPVDGEEPSKDSDNEDKISPCILLAHADEERISRVLTNLVSNAIKFSPPNSTIYLKAQAGNGDQSKFAVVSVTDSGRGIPAESIARIFDRFTQTHITDATELGGSGLGLAICKAIVELHGGAITVESTPGNGSTFTFTLPLAPG